MSKGSRLWSMLELQELLDEWLISCWLNRPHDGLRDPQHPGRAFTPNEKYAALVESAGYVPVALGPEDYIEHTVGEGDPVGDLRSVRRSGQTLVTILDQPVLGDDTGEHSDNDGGARQLTTLTGWRAFVAQRPEIPQLLPDDAWRALG